MYAPRRARGDSYGLAALAPRCSTTPRARQGVENCRKKMVALQV